MAHHQGAIISDPLSLTAHKSLDSYTTPILLVCYSYATTTTTTTTRVQHSCTRQPSYTNAMLRLPLLRTPCRCVLAPHLPVDCASGQRERW